MPGRDNDREPMYRGKDGPYCFTHAIRMSSYGLSIVIHDIVLYAKEIDYGLT